MMEMADMANLRALDVFMPMHLLLGEGGVIKRVGPTMKKLRPEGQLLGRTLDEVFTIGDNGRGTRDGSVPVGTKLYLTFREGAQTPLKGIAMPVGENGTIVLNLSFGISLVAGASEYRLSAGDFAHTDLAIELLYLVEAKAAIMEETKQLNARLQGAKIAAEEQAYTDTLTGLKNRRAMDFVLERMTRSKVPFALMHLDLDYFKSVNDTLGHAAGDTVLQKVAEVLSEETRGDDMVARVGGDEFILVFNKLVDHERLLRTARRIIEKLEVPIPYQDTLCRISGSIGITTTEFYDQIDLDQMIHDADLALYSSKHEGRAQATIYDPALHANAMPDPASLNARR